VRGKDGNLIAIVYRTEKWCGCSYPEYTVVRLSSAIVSHCSYAKTVHIRGFQNYIVIFAVAHIQRSSCNSIYTQVSYFFHQKAPTQKKAMQSTMHHMYLCKSPNPRHRTPLDKRGKKVSQRNEKGKKKVSDSRL